MVSKHVKKNVSRLSLFWSFLSIMTISASKHKCVIILLLLQFGSSGYGSNSGMGSYGSGMGGSQASAANVQVFCVSS